MSDWVVYLLLCNDSTYYCGITNNLERRLSVHNKGRGARYTKTRTPVKLIASSEKMSRQDAMKLEKKVKKLPKQKKLSLLNNH